MFVIWAVTSPEEVTCQYALDSAFSVSIKKGSFTLLALFSSPLFRNPYLLNLFCNACKLIFFKLNLRILLCSRLRTFSPEIWIASRTFLKQPAVILKITLFWNRSKNEINPFFIFLYIAKYCNSVSQKKLFLFLYLVTKIDSSGWCFFPRYFYTRNLIDICSELHNNQLKRETLTRTRNYYKVAAFI